MKSIVQIKTRQVTSCEANQVYVHENKTLSILSAYMCSSLNYLFTTASFGHWNNRLYHCPRLYYWV